ncbi:MAG: UDP-diphosphatase [Phycisphaerales bacterium]|nr:UDP-diphosphatase [Phycisphaerales bacterium]MDB5300875.1 UDP-diphosphatase [Phycisphaerales bacterium]MDB5302894.1 UDP-diphosphatase [Phycisphaerales bacterium]
MTLWHIVILAVIQGAAELLPVSSSAHVIAAARLMGIRDTASPQFTLMLVMLHTGTMFAVIVYFWKAWKRAFFSSSVSFYAFATRVIVATAVTGVIGFGLKIAIEKYMRHSHPGLEKAEIEELFKHLDLLAASLAAVGVLILISGLKSYRQRDRGTITIGDSLAIGAVQGLCLPFRGFSRSGATISVGLLRGVARIRLEEFSFALAVVLTPPIVLREALRLVHHHGETSAAPVGVHGFLPSILGMCFSFIAGLVALKILSRILEKGQWWVFGVYCLAAAGGVYWMYTHGY